MTDNYIRYRILQSIIVLIDRGIFTYERIQKIIISLKQLYNLLSMKEIKNYLVLYLEYRNLMPILLEALHIFLNKDRN